MWMETFVDSLANLVGVVPVTLHYFAEFHFKSQYVNFCSSCSALRWLYVSNNKFCQTDRQFLINNYWNRGRIRDALLSTRRPERMNNLLSSVTSIWRYCPWKCEYFRWKFEGTWTWSTRILSQVFISTVRSAAGKIYSLIDFNAELFL